jgi:plastocyanin
MPRVAISLAACLALLAAALPRAQAPDPGSISGRVTLTTRLKGRALPSTAYPTRAVGRGAHPAGPDIRDVVVYLKDPAVRSTPPTLKAELLQEHESFVPHVLAVTKGTTVDFPNGDPIYHNVFSLSGAGTFDLGRYPQGQSRSQKMAKAGIVKVFCHIHSQMSATILVFDHPYFTIPQESGSFELANVPPGSYTIVGWHERVGERTAGVRVERGRATTIDLSLPVEDPP